MIEPRNAEATAPKQAQKGIVDITPKHVIMLHKIKPNINHQIFFIVLFLPDIIQNITSFTD